MSKPSIGFIGLGLMGFSMCQRLLDLSYPLTIVANRSRGNVDKAVARGAVEVATAREVAERSDIIMLCMDTSESVESRMFGALNGELNIMCSGERDAYDRVEPVLKDLGENVFHLGALGSGHTIKLINNFFAMTTANAMAEAFAMADLMGVEREKLYAVMSAGPLHSGMMDFIKAYAVDGKPDALAFAVRNAKKDVGYYAQMASDVNVDSIMSKSVREVLGAATDDGFGNRMIPEMVDYLSKKYSDSGSSQS